MKILTLLFSFLLCGNVQAQSSNDQDKKLAKQYYKNALTELKNGNHLQAASLFMESYKITNDPAMLYNIASAKEKAGQIEVSIQYYQLYYSHAVGDQKLLVQKHMTDLCDGIPDNITCVQVYMDAFNRTKDPVFFKKIARSKESVGELEEALWYYEKYMPFTNEVEATQLSKHMVILKENIEQKKPVKNDEKPIPNQSEMLSSTHKKTLLIVGSVSAVVAGTFGLGAIIQRNELTDDCGDIYCNSSVKRNYEIERQFSLIADFSLLVSLASFGTVYWYNSKSTKDLNSMYRMFSIQPLGNGK